MIVNESVIKKLLSLGMISESDLDPTYNVGTSDYGKHFIQPWHIWIEYGLDPWDADIVKRILRKKGNSDKEIAQNKKLDYQKIIHICNEKLRQLNET